MEKKDLKSLSYQEMLDEMAAMGEKTFRGKQIYQWLHEKLVSTPDEMGNIPAKLKDRLKEAYTCSSLQMIDVFTSGIDGTQKYLFRLQDGNVIESVLMKYKHGNSVCVSSQVGCRMGCRFCASTLGGLTRNLQTGEILDQVYQIQKYSGERVSNLVLMGTGEPMDNYDNVVKFYRLLTDENGLNMSGRNVTVSTCGIVPGILKLAEENLTLTLALSLHATTDEKRRELMPIANTYSINELMEACKIYFEKTGRRVSFEYALVAGVNDTATDAIELSALARSAKAHVNLIPVNPIRERDYRRGSREAIEAFKNSLEKNRINCTIRREMGTDIDGACGQLRRRKLAEG